MKYIKIISFVIICAVILISGFVVGRKEIVQGSIGDGQAYNATSTLAMNGEGAVAARKQVRLKTGSTIIGSVVIASTTSAYFQVWNATSTTDIASSTVARFATSTAAGTYTFDADLSRGLIVEMNGGFIGDYIITWK